MIVVMDDENPYTQVVRHIVVIRLHVSFKVCCVVKAILIDVSTT